MEIPFKDKQVGFIVEGHNLGTKNLSPCYIGSSGSPFPGRVGGL